MNIDTFAFVSERREYHNLINYRHVTPSEGWGYCTKDCSGISVFSMYYDMLSKSKCILISGGSGHARHLQIVDQSVLPHEDCTKLCESFFKINIKEPIYLSVESIKSPKNVSKSQLCAGHKIVRRRPTKFYEYTGEHRQTNFTEIDPIKDGYRDKYHDKVNKHNFLHSIGNVLIFIRELKD